MGAHKRKMPRQKKKKSDDKERQETRKQEHLLPQDMNTKKMPFQSVLKRSQNICSPVTLIVHQYNFTLRALDEHFCVGKLNVTICHFQMNKNVSSCILIFVFKSKIKVLHIMLDV